MKTTGITLLIIGLLLTFFTATKFFTREKVVDLGSVEITKDEPHNISWSPLFGILVMGVGGILLWRSTKKA